MLEPISKIIEKKKCPNPKQEKGHLIKTKMSKQMITQGFTKMPNIIIADYKLNCQDKSVLLVLYYHAFRNGACWPSQRLISQESGMSKISVIRTLKNLKKFGYIDYKKNGKHNEYFLNIRV